MKRIAIAMLTPDHKITFSTSDIPELLAFSDDSSPLIGLDSPPSSEETGVLGFAVELEWFV